MLNKFNAYALDTSVANQESISLAINNNAFDNSEMGATERQRVGFKPVHAGENNPLFVDGNAENCLFAVFQIATKTPDSSAIKEFQAKRIAELEEKGIENINKKNIKDEVILDLLPKCSPKYKIIKMIFDFKNKIFYCDDSGNALENIKTVLKRSLDNKQCIRKIAESKYSLETLTSMISESSLIPEGFHIGFSANFKADIEDSSSESGSFKHTKLTESEAVESLIAEGYVVSQMEFYLDKRQSFTINKAGSISNIKPLEYVQERLSDVLGEEVDHYATLQTNLIITASDFKDIADVFTNIQSVLKEIEEDEEK